MHLRRSFSFWHLSHATTRRTSMDGTQRQLFSSAAVPTLHGPAGCSALHCLACAALLYELVFVDRPRCCVLPLLGTHIEGGGGAAQRQVASAAAGFPRTRFVGVCSAGTSRFLSVRGSPRQACLGPRLRSRVLLLRQAPAPWQGMRQRRVNLRWLHVIVLGKRWPPPPAKPLKIERTKHAAESKFDVTLEKGFVNSAFVSYELTRPGPSVFGYSYISKS